MASESAADGGGRQERRVGWCRKVSGRGSVRRGDEQPGRRHDPPRHDPPEADDAGQEEPPPLAPVKFSSDLVYSRPQRRSPPPLTPAAAAGPGAPGEPPPPTPSPTTAVGGGAVAAGPDRPHAPRSRPSRARRRPCPDIQRE
jgi:hypothetical protein